MARELNKRMREIVRYCGRCVLMIAIVWTIGLVRDADAEPVVMSCVADDEMLRALDRTKYWTINADQNTMTLENGVEFVITSKNENYIDAERKDDRGYKIRLDRRTLKMKNMYRGDSYTYTCEISPSPKL